MVAGGDEVAEAEAAADGGAAGGAFLCGGVAGDVDLTGDVSGETTGGEGACELGGWSEALLGVEHAAPAFSFAGCGGFCGGGPEVVKAPGDTDQGVVTDEGVSANGGVEGVGAVAGLA